MELAPAASRAGRPHSHSIRAFRCIFTESNRRFPVGRWATSPCWTEIPTRRFSRTGGPAGPGFRPQRLYGWKAAQLCGEVHVMRFAQPGWLWLMILMPLPWLLERARPRIAWPSLDGFPLNRRISWVWLRRLPALLVRIGDRCPGRGARAPADRRRHDQDRRARRRDRGRTRPELEHEHARFPDRPGNQEDFASGRGQKDLHAVCRRSDRTI